jgi:hypothetical protein
MDGGPKDGSAFSLSQSSKSLRAAGLPSSFYHRSLRLVSVWMAISKEFSGGPLFYSVWYSYGPWVDFFGLCPTLSVSVRESKKECVV